MELCLAPRHEPHEKHYVNGHRIHTLKFSHAEAQYTSSTQTELVAVDDIMSQVLWTKYCLEE
jgi:hypothetical protein